MWVYYQGSGNLLLKVIDNQEWEHYLITFTEGKEPDMKKIPDFKFQQYPWQ